MAKPQKRRPKRDAPAGSDSPAVFDEAARTAFLTGFRKRKLERKRIKVEKHREREREERREARRVRRDRKKSVFDQVDTIDAVASARPRKSASAAAPGANAPLQKGNPAPKPLVFRGKKTLSVVSITPMA